MCQKMHKLQLPTADPKTERVEHVAWPLTASPAVEHLSKGFAELIDTLSRLEDRCRKRISEKRGRKVDCSLSLAKLHLEQAEIDALSESKQTGDFSPEFPEWLLLVVTDLTVAMHGRGNYREAALLSQLALELCPKK